VNPDRIPRFKRTRQYSIEDFAFLIDLLSAPAKLFTLAHVMAEVSTLIDLEEPELGEVRELLRSELQVLMEPHHPSSLASNDSTVHRPGLTDAAIITAALQHGLTVLTDDRALTIELQQSQVPVSNFTDLSRQAGRL
jgi:rRNA-processing protein FCF1